MTLAKSTWVIILAWVVFVGGFAAGSLLIPPGNARTAFGDIALCIVPLFANACLLWNASSPYRRQNNFWMLLALGCTVWLAGRLIATVPGAGAAHNTARAFWRGHLILPAHGPADGSAGAAAARAEDARNPALRLPRPAAPRGMVDYFFICLWPWRGRRTRRIQVWIASAICRFTP